MGTKRRSLLRRVNDLLSKPSIFVKNIEMLSGVPVKLIVRLVFTIVGPALTRALGMSGTGLPRPITWRRARASVLLMKARLVVWGVLQAQRRTLQEKFGWWWSTLVRSNVTVLLRSRLATTSPRPERNPLRHPAAKLQVIPVVRQKFWRVRLMFLTNGIRRVLTLCSRLYGRLPALCTVTKNSLLRRATKVRALAFFPPPSLLRKRIPVGPLR